MRQKVLIALMGLGVIVGSSIIATGQDVETVRGAALGAAIWKAKCVTCHGEKGEGVKGKYEHQLTRVGGLDELAALIDETMPEDNPSDCVGAEARSVAAFLLDGILGETESPQPTRRELLHLSTAQLENAIASLGESFLGQKTLDPSQHGLSVKYFDAKEMDQKKIVLERVEPAVDVDFGENGPLGDKTSKEEFSISWSGSIFIAETGSYEFSISSPNGYRLFVNRPDVPLIDSWVATRDEPEKSATIRLPGGRWYPLRLQATKVKDPNFGITLRWRPPRRQMAVIPTSVLNPEPATPVLTTQVELPADDSSQGFSRGALFSAEWDQATTDVGLEVGQNIALHLQAFVGARPGQPDFEKSCRDFSSRFAERAFQRKLSQQDASAYIDRIFAEHTPEESVSLSVLAVIKSPWFQYLGVAERPDRTSEVAQSIAWIISDDLASASLIEALANGQEEDEASLRSMIRRELESPIAAAKWRRFFVEWLGLEDSDELRKDTNTFAEFEPGLADSMQESLLRFVDEVWRHPDADFRRLLQDDHLWLDSRLREVFVDRPTDSADDVQNLGPTLGDRDRDEFVSVDFSSFERAGVLTHPWMLSQLSYFRTTSPIHRGVFVTRKILGWRLNPPPVAVEPVGEEAGSGLTTRERVEMQTRPENCMSCHRVINPFGFALEGYDAIGRIRKVDRDKPVDTEVFVELESGEQVRVDGARSLAEFLVQRRETHRHFVQAVFQHAVRQFPEAYSPTLLDELTDYFETSNFNIRELIVEIALRTSIYDTVERPQNRSH